MCKIHKVNAIARRWTASGCAAPTTATSSWDANNTARTQPPRQQLTVVGLDTRQVYAASGVYGQEGRRGGQGGAGGAGAHRPVGARACSTRCTRRPRWSRSSRPGVYYLAGEAEPAHPVRGAGGPGLEPLPQREHDVASGGRVQTHTIRVTGEMADGPQRLPFPGVRVAAKLLRDPQHSGRSGTARRCRRAVLRRRSCASQNAGAAGGGAGTGAQGYCGLRHPLGNGMHRAAVTGAKLAGRHGGRAAEKFCKQLPQRCWRRSATSRSRSCACWATRTSRAPWRR